MDKDVIVKACSRDYADEKAFELAKGLHLISGKELYLSNILPANRYGNEKEGIAAVKAIYDGEELIGYIVEEINLDFFEKLRQEAGLWKDGTLYLIDGNGELITAGTSEDTRTEFVTDKEERAEFTEQWKKIDLEKEPNGQIEYEVDGNRYITYYSIMKYSSWHIMVSVGLDRFQKETESFQLLIYVTLAILLLLLIFINYFISKKIMSPINAVSEALLRIRKDQNYTLRIKVKNRDEMGKLAEEINVLLEYIEEENLAEKEKQSYLREKAERDSLTKLLNKEAITSNIKEMLNNAKKEERPAALLFIDVDNFKNFNTEYGHTVGDQVLLYVASVLSENLGGYAGRAGGDEFLVGIDAYKIIYSLKDRLQHIKNCLNRGFVIPNTSEAVRVTCSIGVSVSYDGKGSFEEMVDNADKAMYEVKQKGKNGFCILPLNTQTHT